MQTPTITHSLFMLGFLLNFVACKTVTAGSQVSAADSIIKSIAHRGASGHAPENTVAAVTRAIELGADYIEIDVQLSSDGKVVVIHDEDVDRTTDGSGDVINMTAAALKELDAGGWFSPRFNDEKIPFLEELFPLVSKEQKLIIEIKNPELNEGIADKVLELVNQYGASQKVILKSFDMSVLRYIHLLAPDIPIVYVVIGPIAWGRAVIDDGLRRGTIFDVDFADFYQVHRLFVDEKIVNKCHDRGKKIIAWGVNKPSEMSSMRKLNVDIIESDFPDRVN